MIIIKSYTNAFIQNSKILTQVLLKKPILKHYRKPLLKSINKLDLSISSKESFLFMVARWLDINLPEHSTISTFKQAGYNLKVKREKTIQKINNKKTT